MAPPEDGNYTHTPDLWSPDHWLYSDLGRLVIILWVAALVPLLGITTDEEGIPLGPRILAGAGVATLLGLALRVIARSIFSAPPRARYAHGRHRQ